MIFPQTPSEQNTLPMAGGFYIVPVINDAYASELPVELFTKKDQRILLPFALTELEYKTADELHALRKKKSPTSATSTPPVQPAIPNTAVVSDVIVPVKQSPTPIQRRARNNAGFCHNRHLQTAIKHPSFLFSVIGSIAFGFFVANLCRLSVGKSFLGADSETMKKISAGIFGVITLLAMMGAIYQYRKAPRGTGDENRELLNISINSA